MSAKKPSVRSSTKKSITKEGSKVSMTFDDHKDSSGKPLDLAKQRAMPLIQQDEPMQSLSGGEQNKDVVDYQIQDTLKEIKKDQATNPVNNVNRKRLTKLSEKKEFLEGQEVEIAQTLEEEA